MQNGPDLSRRTFLALTAGTLALGTAGCVGVTVPEQAVPSLPAADADTGSDLDTVDAVTESTADLIDGMTQAATRFLDTMSEEQRAQATYPFADEERFRWHWTTPGRVPRNGLPLGEMDQSVRNEALALLASSLSAEGFEKARNIMGLQQELGGDPELYYVTLFGAPGGTDPWGWRVEGHHLSHHFTVRGDRVVTTPFFLGAWPTTTSAGLRAMAREEDAALELVASLLARGQQQVLFQERTLTRHETQNAARVGPLPEVGVPVGEMQDGEQQLVEELLQTYLASAPGMVAEPAWARIEAAGLDGIHFGWAGSTEYAQPQYYRLQGPTFLLEFDNSRNGGTHIHSVWRDFDQDFGGPEVG